MKKYDAIVIGTGTAGQTAAYDLTGEGYKVAIIEYSDSPGGVCALRGCQAKKWFYEVSELMARCSHLKDLGITTTAQANWQQILTEKNKFTSEIPENTIKNFEGNGITFIRGKAAFIDESTLSVDDTKITALYYLIASGAEPATLPIEGSEQMITSDEFLELKALPQRVAFIGGGFISFEFAHFVARLGSSKKNIHILEANDRVLAPFDGDIVQQLVEFSEAEGIQIHTNFSIDSFKKGGNGYSIFSESGDNLEVDLIVNGAGRTPNIKSLQLEAAEVEFSKRGITVDRNMRTSKNNIFAVGDCADSLQLARVADMEAHTAARTIIAEKEGDDIPAGIDYSATPAVLFTYPQLGKLGKTEEQLIEENTRYWKSYDTRLNWPSYLRVGLKHAAYKILVDENDHILGAHFLSDNTTGLLNTFKQAMIGKISVQELHEQSIMSPYPSHESDIIYMLSSFVE